MRWKRVTNDIDDEDQIIEEGEQHHEGCEDQAKKSIALGEMGYSRMISCTMCGEAQETKWMQLSTAGTAKASKGLHTIDVNAE